MSLGDRGLVFLGHKTLTHIIDGCFIAAVAPGDRIYVARCNKETLRGHDSRIT